MSRTARTHLESCSNCHQYADESAALLRLISSQPRVQAPADFDFKLRARIARVSSEPRRPAAFLERLWARSFSWSQVTAVTASVALAATLTTFHFINSGRTGQPEPIQFAVKERGLAGVPSSAGQESSVTESKEPVALARTAGRVTASRPVTVRSMARTIKTPVTFTESSFTEPAEEIAKAGVHKSTGETSQHVYDSQRGQFVSTPNRDFYYGAEGSNSRLAKLASSF